MLILSFIYFYERLCTSMQKSANIFVYLEKLFLNFLYFSRKKILAPANSGNDSNSMFREGLCFLKYRGDSDE